VRKVRSAEIWMVFGWPRGDDSICTHLGAKNVSARGGMAYR
jgi:hypothetical protein